MSTEFSRTLSLLRKERGVSQRMAAADLGVSQALLSHYENGIREPGLAFVVRACDYYQVSADYLLGRTLSRDGAIIVADDSQQAQGPGKIRCHKVALLSLSSFSYTGSKLYRTLYGL